MVQPVAVDSENLPVSGDSPEQEQQDTFDNGAFNPDQLPPELQPGWRQLQGAFTKKTQEMAEERRQLEAQLASLGDTEQVQQALELYTAIQDPRNWAQLHTELSEAMQAHGMTPAQADKAATEALTQPAVPETPDLAGLTDDPELAPLVQSLKAQQQRLEAFEMQQQQAMMQRQAEMEQQAIVYELMNQVSAIREANPSYSDEDIDGILELSSFYNGDVVAAQQRYEQDFQRRMGRYLAGKQAASDIAPSVPPGGSPAASTPVEPHEETLDEVEEWAVEHLRQLQAAGELDV